MSLQSLLEQFKTDVESHITETEAALAAKVQAGKKEVHDAWDSMGADMRALEEKLVTHPIVVAKAALEARVEELEAEVGRLLGLQSKTEGTGNAAG